MKFLLAAFLFFALLASDAGAATYGTVNEECHTDGTLLNSGNWESTLMAATQGTKYRLPAGTLGTLTPSGGVVVVTVGTSEANRIEIVADDCDVPTIDGRIQIGSFITLAGVKVTCSTENPGCVNIRPPTLNGTQWAEGVIIRNNNILASGGATTSVAAVRIDGDVRNLELNGNDINNTIVANTTHSIYVNSNIGTTRPSENIRIINNKIQEAVASGSGSGQCIQFAAPGPTQPGHWAGPDHLIQGNLLVNCLDGPVPGIDIKAAGAANSKITIRGNVLEAGNWTGGCLIVQNETAANTQILIEQNEFRFCDAHSALELGNLGTAAEWNNWRVTVRNNIFTFATTTAWALHNQLENTVFENNSIFKGEFQNGGGFHNPSTLTFRNNAISGSVLDNQGTVSSCTHNVFHNISGDNFDGACTSTRTGNPNFTNAANGDFTINASSSARNTGVLIAAITVDFAGGTRPRENAYDIGAFEFDAGGTPNTVINLVATGTSSTIGTGDTSPTPGLPAGMQANDLMVTVLICRDDTMTATISSGWSPIYTPSITGNMWIFAYSRRYQTGDAAPTWTLTDNNESCIAQVAAFRAVTGELLSVIQVGTESANAAAANIGPITGLTVAAQRGVIVIGARQTEGTSVATLTGDSLTWAEIGDVVQTTGSGLHMAWDFAEVANLTTVTSKTFSITGGVAGLGKGVMLGLGSGFVPSSSRFAGKVGLSGKSFAW